MFWHGMVQLGFRIHESRVVWSRSSLPFSFPFWFISCTFYFLCPSYLYVVISSLSFLYRSSFLLFFLLFPVHSYTSSFLPFFLSFFLLFFTFILFIHPFSCIHFFHFLTTDSVRGSFLSSDSLFIYPTFLSTHDAMYVLG
jgi:hypothetical protein